jgi:hypothetical protein
MNIKSFGQALALLAAGSLLAACGGGDDSPSSSGGSSSSASGASCNYADKVTSSERQQANQCGIQVSGNYAQADSGLASVISACQAGEKATADAYYAGTYTQMVSYARSVAKQLSCGSNTSPTLPNTSTQTYYNLCWKWGSGNSTYTAACYGPVQQGVGGCGDSAYNHLGQYGSQSACITARDTWLRNH